MKNVRRIATILMAVAVLFAMAIPAMALTGGKITIDNAKDGQVYNIYRILELESISDDNTTATYKVSAKWAGWTDELKTYVNIDNQGYVTEIPGKTAEHYENFAKAALAYAKENSIDPDDTATATSATVTFDNLTLGYYLVDSSVGTLCALNTTNKEITIQDKNNIPSIEKTVMEDATGDYGTDNDAQIGDTVSYKIVVNAKKGADNYVLYDLMSENLELKPSTIAVKVGDTALTVGTDYTVDTAATAEYTFMITFTADYLNTITSDIAITVTYDATLTEGAQVNAPETNKAWMTYGDKNTETNKPTTNTETYQFTVQKIDSESKNQISGAQFKLYDAATGGNEIPVVKVSDGVYRVAVEGETGVVIEAGLATIKGLDDDTYYLEETKQPDGYNKLSSRQEVNVTDANDVKVQVENVQGALLPSTGGIGTTIFYAVGGLLVVAAVILLISKKRMTMEA